MEKSFASGQECSLRICEIIRWASQQLRTCATAVARSKTQLRKGCGFWFAGVLARWNILTRLCKRSCRVESMQQACPKDLRGACDMGEKRARCSYNSSQEGGCLRESSWAQPLPLRRASIDYMPEVRYFEKGANDVALVHQVEEGDV